ncbi:MAG TPA: glycosyltransferase family A protein [Roseiflexaceae bacterium]|nr:glycosyltransferase family A protein [Roseiflexaceae bacterium]
MTTSPTVMPKRDTYLVSVVITTRNRSRYLRDAIESVLAVKQQQHPKFDIELIVVDDGSTDDTPEVIKQYPVISIRTTGIGMAGARNTGLHAATGDFFTLLDDDDVWMPNHVAPYIELFEQHPEFGAVHAQNQTVYADLTPYGELEPPGPLQSGWLFEELLTYWPQVGTILTRMPVAREAGDFDSSLTGDNDWDWLLRIARRYPIGRLEVPVLLFRQRCQAEEQLAWRRFPAMITIFHRHTRPLGLLRRLQLRPILWRHRGWWATFYFLRFAHMHYAAGEYKRAYRSLYYAVRCSPAHTVLACLRSWPFKQSQQSSASHSVS